jgi:hypothetical protein
MPDINTTITTSDVQTPESQHLAFEVIRDAIVGQFLDNAPNGVTLEVIETKGGAGWPSGWTVKADISKAIADLAKRHEALNDIGAGIYENAAYGVQREVVRGYGNLVTVAQVLLNTSRAGYRGERSDLNVTLPSLSVSEDDRNDTRVGTAQRGFKDQVIKVATIRKAAAQSGLTLLEGIERAAENLARLEKNANETVANRAAQAEVTKTVNDLRQVLPSVETKTRKDASYTEVSFPLLSHAEALAVLKAVAALNLPAAR